MPRANRQVGEREFVEQVGTELGVRACLPKPQRRQAPHRHIETRGDFSVLRHPSKPYGHHSRAESAPISAGLRLNLEESAQAAETYRGPTPCGIVPLAAQASAARRPVCRKLNTSLLLKMLGEPLNNGVHLGERQLRVKATPTPELETGTHSVLVNGVDPKVGYCVS